MDKAKVVKGVLAFWAGRKLLRLAWRGLRAAATLKTLRRPA